MNNLSHSAASKYMDCAQSYKYWYIDKLRPKTQKAALLFGSAVDKAVTSMFNTLKTGVEEHKPENVFEYAWRFADVNGVNTHLPDCIDIVYADSDFDFELLGNEQVKNLEEQFKLDNAEEKLKAVYTEKKRVGFDRLNLKDKELLNKANWMCLFQKGLLMIEAVKRDFIPNIEKVYATQVYVKLENQDQDKVIGFADLVAKWKGYDKPIIFDLKTSTRDYEPDSVLVSPQLTLYVHSLSDQFDHTRTAGFLVLKKLVYKNRVKVCSKCAADGSGGRHKTCPELVNGDRCNGAWLEKINPEVKTQMIINDIPEQTEDIVLENFDNINLSINHGIFHRNFQSCIKPYGKCPYYGLCYKNDMDGLVKKEDK